MHALVDRSQILPRGIERPARSGAAGGSHAGIGFRDKCGNLRHITFDLASQLGARFGGFASGVLSVLSAVERFVQSLAVVALRDGILRPFERGGRRRVLGRGVFIRTGGSRGVDGALCLVHLLVGGIAAGRQQQRGKNGHGEAQGHEQFEYSAMKEVAKHDRPREKLQRLGVAALGDNELVAIVLGSGSRDCGALELANRVLGRAGGLHGLTRVAPDQLCVPGVGDARAAQIVAAVELGRRTLVRAALERPRYHTPQQLAGYLLPQYGAASVEQFGIVMLDTKHRVIRVKVVAIGSLDSAVVHPREVFREAVAVSAAAIVLFHNHPSGDPTPSGEDLLLTQRMLHAGDIMGIDVLDHLILADQRYYSLVEAGELASRVG